MPFLPITKTEMLDRGWYYTDFIIVTGDAYVDMPSFGTAIISRVLESCGYKVCIISQPQNDADFSEFGKPRYGFFVNSGSFDSMVANYSVTKNRRKRDELTPGGIIGKRPDRAVTVYCKKIREIYGDVPIIIGGLEASLRRFAHYDYWDDKIMPSILFDSTADLIIYGMGENQTVEIAKRLTRGQKISDICDVKGTCFAVNVKDYTPRPCAECPSYEQVLKDKRQYAISCRIEQDEQDAVRGKTIIQRHGNMMLVQNPPMPPLETAELDKVYALPYMREAHPSYDKLGGVPGIEEVRFSITHNRGCFGGCNFCSIAFHQGRQITCRSEQSVIDEAIKLTEREDFKGYIHDVGGPTADFRHPSCKQQEKNGMCKGKKCLAPKPCPNLVADHTEYLQLLKKLRALPKVKKVFIRSGIRFDYLMCDKDDSFFEDLVKYHISGQLKVAPEHCSANVLGYMGKPPFDSYIKFKKKYTELNRKFGTKQYLVPYLMSSHPGSTINDAINLAVFLKKEGMHPEQVQDFYPTPGTISTCMFYTELDPYTLKPVYVPKTSEEKAEQRALLQYFLPQNRHIVLKALKKASRYDLIGHGSNCLIADDKPKNNKKYASTTKPPRHKKSNYRK